MSVMSRIIPKFDRNTWM